ncbi:MAG: hypothetical protein VB104_07940 [Candidatus Limiplasma sp.]|nr:hypothetical protein [Candidatus Limiplasma sp.]
MANGKSAGPEFKTRVSIEADKEYKESMKDIASRIRLVRSELSLADAEYKANDGSVTALTSRYASLEKQYDIEREKMGLISEQLEKAKAAYGEGSEQVAYWETQLNNANTAVTKTEGAMRDTAESVLKAEDAQKKETHTTTLATVAKKALTTALGATAQAMKTTLVAAAAAAGAAIAGLAAATGAAVKQGFDLTKAAAENVDGLMTLSAQTGVGTTTLQQWGYAARFIDTDVTTMTGSMGKMVKKMSEAAGGSDSAKKSFKELGVNIKNTHGGLRDSEDVFMDAIDALGKMSNESERDALAMELFGESAQQLNPLIEAGSDKLRALGLEAQRTGMVMGGGALEALGGFDDAMQRFQSTGEGLKNTIAAGLVPVFQPFVDMATDSMGRVSDALADGLQPGELDGILQSTMLTLKTAVASVGKLITDAIPIVTEALTGLVEVAVTILPGLVNALLPGALGLLKGVLDAIMQNVEPLTQLAVNLLTQLSGFLVENVPTLLAAAESILMGLIDGIIAALPELIPMAVTMLASFASALVGAIPELSARLPEIVKAIMDGLLMVDWIGLGLNLIQGLVNGLVSATGALLGSITEVFKGIWKAILKVFGIASPSTEAQSAAKFILDGLVQGFEAAVDAVVDTVKRIFGKIWDAIKSIFGFGGGESDESKEARSAGSDIMEGMKAGIAGGEEAVKAAAKNVAMTVLAAIRDALGITEEGGSAAKLTYVGEGVVDGIVQGLNQKSVTAFGGPAYNAAHYLAAAFNGSMGIAGYGFSAAGSAADKYQYIGSAICDGIVAGLYAGNSRVTAAAKTVALAAYNAAKKALEISSPSKKFRYLAEMSADGYAQGLTARIAALRASVSGATGALTTGTARALSAETAQGIDYARLGSAVAEAMEARGVGQSDIYLDGQYIGGAQSVVTGVSRTVERRARSGIRGRAAALVIG